MNELITKSQIENIIKKQDIKITSKTTPEEILEIIVQIIYESINNIKIDVLSEKLARHNANELRKKGIKI